VSELLADIWAALKDSSEKITVPREVDSTTTTRTPGWTHPLFLKVDVWQEDSAGPPLAAPVHRHLPGHERGGIIINWQLKNSLSDCVYQNDKNSLRRNMAEIKTYEEVYTGRTVNQVKVWDLNISQVITGSSRTTWITVCIKADFYLFCIKELFAPAGLELKHSRCKYILI
jgi:hypothetical protein